MPITQSRLHDLLLCAEFFEQSYTGTADQAEHEYQRIIRASQSASNSPVPADLWESAFMNLYHSLKYSNHVRQSVIIAREREKYNHTAQQNLYDRLRQERKRREAGMAIQRPAAHVGGTESLRQGPSSVPSAIHVPTLKYPKGSQGPSAPSINPPPTATDPFDQNIYQVGDRVYKFPVEQDVTDSDLYDSAEPADPPPDPENPHTSEDRMHQILVEEQVKEFHRRRWERGQAVELGRPVIEYPDDPLETLVNLGVPAGEIERLRGPVGGGEATGE